MIVRSALVSLGLAFVLLGCDNDPGKGIAKATADAPAPTTAAQPAAAGAKYSFSNDGSKVEYTGAKVTGKHDGQFAKFTGTITAPEGAPEKGAVNADIDVDSITAEDEHLLGHLKSPDFFDVAKFPKAKFTSTAIKAGGEGGATHTVTGNLELHGVTKSITFPATIKTAADHVDVDAAFAINRKDFGIVYPGKPDDLIKDDVAIKLTIRAKKAG
jgi:polyisoprenoid-binding protein YceI